MVPVMICLLSIAYLLIIIDYLIVIELRKETGTDQYMMK